jgi:hypothetical protein
MKGPFAFKKNARRSNFDLLYIVASLNEVYRGMCLKDRNSLASRVTK